jgi:AcrR family transcriptional regulator
MPGRPLRAESLSEAAIVDAALRLASTRGLEQVRMRDVAAELDVAVGALYHHVPSQAAMQSAVVQHVLEGLPTPNEIGGTPRQRIVATMRAIQQVLDDNPGISANVIAAAPRTESGGTIRRQLLAALHETGLTQAEAERAYLGFEWLWLGSRVAPSPDTYDKSAFDFVFDALLDGLLPRGRQR